MANNPDQNIRRSSRLKGNPPEIDSTTEKSIQSSLEADRRLIGRKTRTTSSTSSALQITVPRTTIRSEPSSRYQISFDIVPTGPASAPSQSTSQVATPTKPDTEELENEVFEAEPPREEAEIESEHPREETETEVETPPPFTYREDSESDPWSYQRTDPVLPIVEEEPEEEEDFEFFDKDDTFTQARDESEFENPVDIDDSDTSFSEFLRNQTSIPIELDLTLFNMSADANVIAAAEKAAETAVKAIIDSSANANIPGPGIFTGRENAVAWMFKVENILKCRPKMADSAKIAYFTSYLTDSALEWWFNYNKGNGTPSKLWDEVKNDFLANHTELLSYEGLKDALKNRKKLDNETYENYFQAIQYLCNNLQQVGSKTKIPDERRVEYMIRGLPKEIASQVWSKSPKTPADVINQLRAIERFESMFGRKSNKNTTAVHEIDTKVVGEVGKLAKTVSHLQGAVNKITKTVEEVTLQQNNYRPKNNYQQRYVPQNKPNVYNPRNFGRNDQQKGKVDRTADGRPICFNCNKPGHMKFECRGPKRNNGQTQNKNQSQGNLYRNQNQRYQGNQKQGRQNNQGN